MRSIVRKGTGEDWKEYLRELAKEEGIENPSDEDIQRIYRGRKGKKVSNKEWQSKTDTDSYFTKMKDVRTHLVPHAGMNIRWIWKPRPLFHVMSPMKIKAIQPRGRKTSYWRKPMFN